MKNLVTVLFSPTATFAGLRERKLGWIAAFIALLVVTPIGLWLQTPLMEKTLRAALEKANSGVDIESMIRFSQQTSYITTPVITIVVVLLGALLLLFVNMIVRGEAKYGQLVTVYLYANVPVMIETILSGILARVTDADSVKDITLSAAAMLPDKTGLTFELTKLLNPFSIFALILVVIGTAVMARKPRGSVAVWIVGGWLVFKIISALVGSLAQGLAA
ncbi:MAG TPA: YIP1 family protein [Bacilli bacterium]